MTRTPATLWPALASGDPVVSDEEAREGTDAKALADRAITLASLYGKPSQTQHVSVGSPREKVQAISLLIEAARMIEARAYSLTDDTLRLLDLYRRADCDDHERLAEIGEALAELWSHMAEHERELADEQKDT